MFNNTLSLRSYEREIHSHTHDFAQLVLPITGAMELEIDAQSSIVTRDVGAYIPPNARHCFAGSAHNLFLVADLAEKQNVLNSTHISNVLCLDDNIKKLVQFAHSYLIDNTNDFHTHSLINQLLCNLLLKSSISIADKRIIKAKHWIDIHCLEAIDLSQIAQLCCLSLSQIQRLFKQYMGCSLAEYWRTKKLEKAKILLLNSGYSIETISNKLAYENVSAFSRRFSQTFGESPLVWRNKRLAAKKMRVSDNSF